MQDSESSDATDAQDAYEEAILTSADKIEAERGKVLQFIAAGKLDSLQERVAWLLNHYPSTRDSDVALQLAYWEKFENNLSAGNSVLKEDLYVLTRLTTIARARAKIQNTYRLFQASSPVRERRGTLSESERKKAVEQKADFPVFEVYADESGKTGKYLIVGGVWVLHAPEIFPLFKEITNWRAARGFKSELHFKNINNSNLIHYMSFAKFLAERSAVLSFKAIRVERAGIKNIDEALNELYYHLLVRGVEHEDASGRATLPRGIQLWKDLEEIGRDKLLLAALKERIDQAAVNRFNKRLGTQEFVSVESKSQPLIQASDLFVSSINRVLNAEGDRTGPKDQFADHFLDLLHLPHGPLREEQAGDMSVHVSL